MDSNNKHGEHGDYVETLVKQLRICHRKKVRRLKAKISRHSYDVSSLQLAKSLLIGKM